jgi:hypothetical protein
MTQWITAIAVSAMSDTSENVNRTTANLIVRSVSNVFPDPMGQ